MEVRVDGLIVINNEDAAVFFQNLAGGGMMLGQTHGARNKRGA